MAIFVCLAILSGVIFFCEDRGTNGLVDPIDNPTIIDDNAAWSPDGGFLAYTHYRRSIEDNPDYPLVQIWIYDIISDSSYRFLYPAMAPRWSQDGSKLFFVQSISGTGNIYFYEFGQDTIIRVTNDNSHGIFDLSPGGESIVTMSGSNSTRDFGLWLIDYNNNYYRCITPGDPSGDTPRWSRHSGNIIYNRAELDIYYQFAISDSMGNFIGYIHRSNWLQYAACWGPGDSLVAITDGIDAFVKRPNVWIKNRNAGALFLFTKGWAPDWSNDGNWIAFTDGAINPRRFTIWVMRLDGTGKREISRRSYADIDTVAIAPDAYPRCVLPEAVKARLRGQ